MSAACYIGGFGVALPAGLAFARAAALAPPSPLPAAVRRRASPLTRALADAYAQAVGAAECDARSVATIVGSAWGETGILAELLDQLAAGEAELSPLRFAGSVHNAASGQIAIATQNQGFTTSIAAGLDTLAMAIVEAQALLQTGEPEVLILLGDLDPPAHLAAVHERCDPLAVALHLHDGSRPRPRLARLHPLQKHPMDAQFLLGNPLHPVLQLLHAVDQHQNALVQLGPLWKLQVEARLFPPIADLLPHRAPMIWLDEVVFWDRELTICALKVVPGRPFFTQQGADPIVVLELMAQCIAAWVGLSGQESDAPIAIGYLLGSRELRMLRTELPTGALLHVSSRRIFGDDALGSFACTVTDALGLVADAVLTVVKAGPEL